MLETAGDAVVVGADPELLRHARARGWRVLAPAAARA
jgi:phosphoserine phosphatase